MQRTRSTQSRPRARSKSSCRSVLLLPLLSVALCLPQLSSVNSRSLPLQDALILAKGLDFDVFNALNILDQEEVLNQLKFGIGDGHLQYYLYNWRCRDMPPNEVGLVLL